MFEVLTQWISSSGSAGVTEALIAKLTAAGVDLSANTMQKTGMLSRRKSMDGLVDRSRLLKLAVANGQFETAQVLLPFSDPNSRDVCIPTAIRQGNTPITELMLQYGANVGKTAEGQDAFRQACSIPMLSGMIKLILQSDGLPGLPLASQAMADAVRVGCLETVQYLSRSTITDGDFNQAEALQLAVSMGRKDLALTIIQGNRPPQPPGVSQAFGNLIHNQDLMPATKLQLAELLLCAGARGDALSYALKVACDSHFYEMASLLAAYGVSIEYEDASVLKKAIENSQMDLVRSLLNESATLNPVLASDCVSSIPSQASTEERYLLLNSLLRKGAKGRPLDEMLIVAAETGDVASVELLLKPYFPGTPSAAATNGASYTPKGRKPSGQTYERHEVASTDYKDGEALRTAVHRIDTKMVGKILAGRPSPATLSKVFPLTRSLTAVDRYQMVELFLKGALSGPPLHAALQDAIAEDRSKRDDNLIKLLLEHNADVNFNQGPGLQNVILQGDMPLLKMLMAKASPQTAAAQLGPIMDTKWENDRFRFELVSLMLNAGAAVGTAEVTAALLKTMKQTPSVDLSLFRLLLEYGNADVNSTELPVTSTAIGKTDHQIFMLLLEHGKPSPETISRSLTEISALPSLEDKMLKMRCAFHHSRRKEDLGSLLANEIQSLIRNQTRQPTYSTLKLLLERGADPNEFNGAALCYAVGAANTPLSDVLLECQTPPTTATLSTALPHALKIPDLMDRLTFTKKLITAGAAPVEINRGLVHSIGHYTADVSLLSVLASAADTSDGEALALAVAKESPEIVNLLLSKAKHSSGSKDLALDSAMGVKDRAIRRNMCQRLLKEGVSQNMASKALETAARDGDVDLGNILMVHGASISSNNGQAIIEACRGGSAEVVEVLLRTEGQVHKRTLERSFQAATEVRDLNKRAVIFEKLLRRGVSGEPVDSQLVSAARYGESGHEVLRVLLAAGADPNYNGGEAVVAAASTAFMGNLEILLGLWDEENRQKRPSHPTLIRALKASWKLSRDSRFKAVSDLFKAGMPATDDVHFALNTAVNEETPEERLVKLLLDNGASPIANDCKTLVDAVQQGAAASLKHVLDAPIPQEAINLTFSRCFTPDNFRTWFSESGLQTIQLLLDKGAQGGALSQMLLQVMRTYTLETKELAHHFFDLLVSHGLDVDYQSGLPLQEAAAQANVEWIKKLLRLHPSTESLSYAFQHIFDTSLDQEEALQLFELFSEYRDGETRVDVMAQKPGTDHILVRAMSQYPRSTEILKTLLDAGFYVDQPCFYRLFDDVEEEEGMTLLLWAIAQPQKKISSNLIKLLLACDGMLPLMQFAPYVANSPTAKVNAESSLSSTTPLMLAVQNRRPDLVKELVLHGADADMTDYRGRSPLSMATDIGGKVANEMLGNILAGGDCHDDGSLHNAARDLNLEAVKVIVGHGHDPDFPSPSHDGRSALGEICLKASDREMTTEREKIMGKVIAYLITNGSDLSIKSEGKSILYLCFEAKDPVATTRVLLKAGMWKQLNTSSNHYTDENHTYSPTMYVKRILPDSDYKADLLKLLYANRATDVFFANEGPQPADATGLPEDMKIQERARRARAERIQEDAEDFSLAMARKRELASVENNIWKQKAEMEDARRRKLHNEDLHAVRSKAQLEENLEREAYTRKMSEQRSLTESSVSRTKAIAAAELESQDQQQRKQLEWDTRANRSKLENEQAMSALRLSEREEGHRLAKIEEAEKRKTLEKHTKYVDSQMRLMSSLEARQGSGNVNGRQIGFVSGELN